MTDEKQKPQLIVRREKKVYAAKFDEDVFSDDFFPRGVWNSSNFENYLTVTSMDEITGLELVASAAMPFRSYTTTTEGYMESKSQFNTRMRNIASQHFGILSQAQGFAEMQRAPYFGVIVLAEKGGFPKETEDVEKDPLKDLIIKEKFIEEKVNQYHLKPVQTTWTLFPTVNLYGVRGEEK